MQYAARWAVVVAMLVVGCAGGDDGDEGSTGAPVTAPSTTPPVIAPDEPDDVAVAPREVPLPDAPRAIRVEAVRFGSGRRGAIDLHADHWGGRALDPRLIVGDVELRSYEFPAIGVLRYPVDDLDALPRGAPVMLQWGDDPRSRRVVDPSLEVP